MKGPEPFSAPAPTPARMRAVHKTFQTAVAGLTAYTVGRSLAEEWKRGRTPLDELKRAWEHEKTPVATAAAGLALLGYAWVRNPGLLVAAGAGALVGSGLLEHAMTRFGKHEAAAQLESGPSGTTPSERERIKAWDGRDVTT